MMVVFIFFENFVGESQPAPDRLILVPIGIAQDASPTVLMFAAVERIRRRFFL